jgi:hypothetical protein
MSRLWKSRTTLVVGRLSNLFKRVLQGAIMVTLASSSLLRADSARHDVERYVKCIKEWDAARAGPDPQRMEAAASALRKWKEQQGPEYVPQNEQERASFELLDYYIARAWATSGDYKKALVSLQKEAAPYDGSTARGSKGGFLDNTRNPDYHALDVFALHSEIMAHSGVIEKIPGAAYQVIAAGERMGAPVYAFIYEPIDECEGGILIEGVAAGEQRQMIILIARNSEKPYERISSQEVIGKRGRVRFSLNKADDGCSLSLAGVTKFVEYVGEFEVPTVRRSPLSSFELKISDGELEPPVDAIKRVQAKAPQTKKDPDCHDATKQAKDRKKKNK